MTVPCWQKQSKAARETRVNAPADTFREPEKA
jgi:hypothetical protein